MVRRKPRTLCSSTPLGFLLNEHIAKGVWKAQNNQSPDYLLNNLSAFPYVMDSPSPIIDPSCWASPSNYHQTGDHTAGIANNQAIDVLGGEYRHAESADSAGNGTTSQGTSQKRSGSASRIRR